MRYFSRSFALLSILSVCVLLSLNPTSAQDQSSSVRATDDVRNAPRENPVPFESAEIRTLDGHFFDNPSVILYNNGPLGTGPTTKSGVAAPAGTNWSEVQNPEGDTTQANTTSGFSGGQASATAFFRLADNFIVPTGQTWTLDSVTFYAYQTGGTNLPFAHCNLRVWLGRPGELGSIVVFGDTTTNRLSTTGSAALYRIFNTKYPTGTAPGTTRLVQYLNVRVSPALELPEGEYWLDWQTVPQIQAAHFAPSVTIVNRRGQPGWNARQRTAATSAPPLTWQDALDAGNPATAPDSVQDFPFILMGRVPTSVGDNLNGVPENYKLAQNYPNPFNPTTTIEYGLPSSGTVSLKVYNLLGQEVATLASGDKNAGTHQVVWDGRTTLGTPVSSGLYFYRLDARSSAGAYTNLKKMLLLK